jgi:hypothetical protein
MKDYWKFLGFKNILQSHVECHTVLSGQNPFDAKHPPLPKKLLDEQIADPSLCVKSTSSGRKLLPRFDTNKFHPNDWYQVMQ